MKRDDAKNQDGSELDPGSWQLVVVSYPPLPNPHLFFWTMISYKTHISSVYFEESAAWFKNPNAHAV